MLIAHMNNKENNGFHDFRTLCCSCVCKMRFSIFERLSLKLGEVFCIKVDSGMKDKKRVNMSMATYFQLSSCH